ncbi:hypothetical protein ACIA8J_14990 [Streptomyces asoensis]|uniref:hypothetical protein n=1 Tax=Streptomyces asoensis TaxID=249586 RepID=UPI0037AEEB8A
MTLMDVLVDFARTGRIGALRCGMPLAEAENLLGPGRPHPAIRLLGPDIDGYPYSWGGLDLVVTRRTVDGIRINLWPGSTVKLPSLVLPDSESSEATVLREGLLAALDAAGCEHHVNDTLTFGEQSSVLTRPADVCAVFSLPGRDDHVPHRDRHYLDVMHKRVDLAGPTP